MRRARAEEPATLAFTFAQTEVIKELLDGFSRRVFLAILN